MINKLIQERLIRYIATYISGDFPFQCAVAFLGALTITVTGISFFVFYCKNYFSNSVRTYTPETHKIKKNTPTMGGLCIILSVVCALYMTGLFYNPHIYLFIITFVGFGMIGLVDDMYKFYTQKGIHAKTKAMLQLVFALFLSKLIVSNPLFTHVRWMPFASNRYLVLNDICSIAWSTLLLLACSNAVNLTDGLDGLVVECFIPNLCALLCMFTLTSHSIIAEYLGLIYTSSSILILPTIALLGSLMGFLWFNTFPARIFMGDVGSLALGSALGYLFFHTQYELLLLLSGIVFVGETVSVILQVSYFRWYKKRIFKMTPLHHHYELSGMHEAQIVKRCGLISWGTCSLVILFFCRQLLYSK